MTSHLRKTYGKDRYTSGRTAFSALLRSDVLPLLEEGLQYLMRTYHFDAGSVYLPSMQDAKAFEIVNSAGFSREYLIDTHYIRPGRGFCGTALGLDEIRLTEDVGLDPRYTRDQIKIDGFKSFVALPIDPQIGLINLASKEGMSFASEDIEAFTFIKTCLARASWREVELSRTVEHLHFSERLSSLRHELMEARDIGQLTHIVAEESRLLLDASTVLLYLSDSSQKLVTMRGFKERSAPHSLYEYLESLHDQQELFTVACDETNEQNEEVSQLLKNNDLDQLFCFNIFGHAGYRGCLCVGQTSVSLSPHDGEPYIHVFPTDNQLYALEQICIQTGASLNRIDHQRQQVFLAALEEHARISRETHDFMAQEIVSIQRMIEALVLRLSPEEKKAYGDEYDELLDMVHVLYSDTRDLIAGLRVCEKMSAAEGSIERYLDYFSRHSKVDIECHIDPNLELSDYARMQLFRIVQEALTNVRKHSMAQNAVIRIVPDTSGVHLSIVDDGIGFEVNELSEPDSEYGITIMKERATSVGGQFVIESKKGDGTSIEVFIPKNTLGSKT